MDNVEPENPTEGFKELIEKFESKLKAKDVEIESLRRIIFTAMGLKKMPEIEPLRVG